jgi:hypothetical protein
MPVLLQAPHQSQKHGLCPADIQIGDNMDDAQTLFHKSNPYPRADIMTLETLIVPVTGMY